MCGILDGMMFNSLRLPLKIIYIFIVNLHGLCICIISIIKEAVMNSSILLQIMWPQQKLEKIWTIYLWVLRKKKLWALYSDANIQLWKRIIIIQIFTVHFWKWWVSLVCFERMIGIHGDSEWFNTINIEHTHTIHSAWHLL